MPERQVRLSTHEVRPSMRGRVAFSAIIAALLLGLVPGFLALRSARPSLAQQASDEETFYLAYTVNNVGYIETCG